MSKFGPPLARQLPQLSIAPRRHKARGRSNLRRGRPHHLLGDAIRLVLQRIIDITDSDLRLNDARQARRAERGSRF
jgi:hypothetical protein